MQIRYINEAFKKISDLKKDINKETSADKIQSSVANSFLSSVIDNINAENDFIKNEIINYSLCNLFEIYNQAEYFIYEGLSNDILNLSIKLDCDNINTQIVINLRDGFLLDKKTSKKDIDKAITRALFAYCDKNKNLYELDVKNIIRSVHINKIVLNYVKKKNDKILINFENNFISSYTEQDTYNFLRNFNDLFILKADDGSKPKIYTERHFTSISELNRSCAIYKNLYDAAEYNKNIKDYNVELFCRYFNFKADSIHLYETRVLDEYLDLDNFMLCKKINDKRPPFYFATTWDNDTLDKLLKSKYIPNSYNANGLYFLISSLVWLDFKGLNFSILQDLIKSAQYFSIISKNAFAQNKHVQLLKLYTFEGGNYLGSRSLKFHSENKPLRESFKRISGLKKDIDKRSTNNTREAVIS